MLTPVDHAMIFDLGMHHGHDTDFYLRKGFRVVALEANPQLCERGSDRFNDDIASGRLTIVERALWDKDDEELSFFINPVKDDWSSVLKYWAEKGGHDSIETRVRTITLPRMFETWGIPHYIKCDIEGADKQFVEQLISQRCRPNYVSVEAISERLLDQLSTAGYSRFQIVNQAFNHSIAPPNPAREGDFADVKFNGHMSGLFGNELDPSKWISLEECKYRHKLFRELKNKDPMLAHGWLDFHAAL